VIRFTDITPLEDIESGTDHPTDLDADPKQVNAYQIFRRSQLPDYYPGDRNRSNLTTVNSLAEARDIYNNHASKDATGGTLSESIDTYAGRTMLANAPAFRDLCRGTVSDYLDATSLTYPRTSPEKQTRSKPLRRSRNPRSDSVFQLNSSPRSTVTNTPSRR